MGNNNNVTGKSAFFSYRPSPILCTIYSYSFRTSVPWRFFFFIRNTLGLLGVCSIRWKFSSPPSCFGIVFFCETVKVPLKPITGIFQKKGFYTSKLFEGSPGFFSPEIRFHIFCFTNHEKRRLWGICEWDNIPIKLFILMIHILLSNYLKWMYMTFEIVIWSIQ